MSPLQCTTRDPHRHFTGEVVEIEEEPRMEGIPEAFVDEQFLEISVKEPVRYADH